MACVELDLPLSTRYLSAARAVAASLGADAGWSIDEIDDLRLAIDEAASIVADVDGATTDGDEGRLHIGFDVADGVIEARVTRHHLGGDAAQAGPATVQIDELAQRILTAVVDRFEVEGAGLLLVKSSAR